MTYTRKIIAILGQLATGKTTLADYLQAQGMEPIQEYTTRPTRAGEVPRHIAVDDDTFTAMLVAGDFAAHMEYHTVHGVWRYGISRASLRESPVDRVLATNPVHVLQLIDAGYQPFVAFLDIPQEVYMGRALLRGDKPAEIGRRVTENTPRFDRLVMSGAADLRITD